MNPLLGTTVNTIATRIVVMLVVSCIFATLILLFNYLNQVLTFTLFLNIEEAADQYITSNSSTFEKDDNKAAENILPFLRKDEDFWACQMLKVLLFGDKDQINNVTVLNTKRINSANIIFTRLLSNEPGNSTAIHGLSLLRVHEQKWHEAVACNTQCIDLSLPSKEMGSVFIRRALAQGMLDNLLDMKRDLESALNYQLSDKVRGVLEGCLNHLREQITTKSNEFKTSGDVVFIQKDYNAALDFYTQAYETNPDNIDALGGMANVQGILLRWDAAVVSNTALLETNLSDTDRMAAIFRRGYASAKLNQAAEAIEDLELVLSMNLPTQQRSKAQEFLCKMKELKLSEDMAKFEQEMKDARASLEAERAAMEAERSRVMALKASEDAHMETGEEKVSGSITCCTSFLICFDID